MRKLFSRTSGSPQAPAIVETPAHYAPTLICCSLALLFEVVIRCLLSNMSLHSFQNARAKLHKIIRFTHL